MPEIVYEGRCYALETGQTVLDALLANGVPAAHSCMAGSCGSCMMRATTGAVPANAQSGLKDAWKAQGYFLPCICRPDADLTITAVGSDAQLGASIASIEPLSASVVRVRLRCDSPLSFRAGQYVSILREGGMARSYSVASLPGSDEIELHVRLIAGGRMSGWFHADARPGDRLTVLGPSGDCFYVAGNEDQPLLLAGTGTGLAPLYGILRDALSHGHRAPIRLFHGALDSTGLYLRQELQNLAACNPHFEYTPAVLNGDETEGHAIGSIEQVVLARLPKLSGWRGYVCGDAAIVRTLRKKLFLSGMASKDIYGDAFLPAATG